MQQMSNFAEGSARRELRLGVLGAVVLVMALVVTAVVYLIPVGKSVYKAQLGDAQSITVGDEVRLAGIPVGKVKSLALAGDHVNMTFTVTKSVFVGNMTTLEIRMLTVVGGHYLAVVSAGDEPLGSSAIPADHVKLPYSLTQSLEDAAKPAEQVDGNTLRANFASLQQAMGRSPDALRHVGNALESVVDILNRQNADVSRSLQVADEYLTAINASKAVLGTFVRQLDLLQTVMINKKDEITVANDITADVLARIASIVPAWNSQLKPLVDKLFEAAPQIEDLGRKLDAVIKTVTGMQESMKRIVKPESGITIDQSSATLDAVCVPVPGKAC
ncbi:MlaD family protein [Nocardia nova]|uniref:MlaD family protein n=1 Tax=Nocardia nova TaxID=37330 RepID=UPI003400AF82